MPCVPSRLCHVRDLRRSQALRPGTGSHQTRPRWHLTGLAASRAESSTALCLRATRCSGSLGRHMRPPHGHIQGYKEIPAGPHCVPQISPFTGRQVPSAAPWTGLSLQPLGCGVGAPVPGPWIRRAAFTVAVLPFWARSECQAEAGCGSAGTKGRRIYFIPQSHPPTPPGPATHKFESGILSGKHSHSATYYFGSSYFKTY